MAHSSHSRSSARPRACGFALATVLATGVMSFLVGFGVGRHQPAISDGAGSLASNALNAVTRSLPAGGKFDADPLESFMEVYQLLKLNFYKPIGDEEKPKLSYGAIRGMLRELGDPYTRFMEPKDYSSFRQDNQGHFKGIGALLGIDKDYNRIQVIKVFPANPAAEAGLRAGDYILKVDGEATDDMSLDACVAKIRGEGGTQVKLTVQRLDKPKEKLDPELLLKLGVDPDEPRRDPAPGDPNKEIEITITRGDVHVPVVESEMLPNNLGYVYLGGFNEETYRQMSDAIAALKAKGMKGLVLDVRDNPGGNLEEVIHVVSYFIRSGPVVFIQSRDRQAEAQDVNPKFYGNFDLPLVVLVNGFSASASEILSGALQDYKRATIIGEKTFGKGLVQTVLGLSDDSALVVTTSVYLTPNKRDINKRGVEPDLAVPWDLESQRDKLKAALAADQKRIEWDIQLQKAVEHLSDLISGKAKVGEPAGQPAVPVATPAAATAAADAAAPPTQPAAPAAGATR